MPVLSDFRLLAAGQTLSWVGNGFQTVALAVADRHEGRLPRFRVPVGGLGIHFVHARGAGPALPLATTSR